MALILGHMGIGDAMWSEGIKDGVTELSARHGWEGKTYTHRAKVEPSQRLETFQNGPIVMVGHSAGVNAIARVLRRTGVRVQAVFAVAPALDTDFSECHIDKLYWITANRDLRIRRDNLPANTGDAAVEEILFDATHTDVDNSKRLWRMVEKEMVPMTQTQPFYMGSYAPITDAELIGVAVKFEQPEAHVRAVFEVESAGRGSTTSGALRHLYEPHVMWRNLKSGVNLDIRDALQRAGHAYPSWKRGAYPQQPYERTDEVIEIISRIHPAGEAGAIELVARSCSWGLGQILGENAIMSGYTSATDMVNKMRMSELAQMVGMMGFIEGAQLDGHLRAGRMVPFAEGYNGPRQAEHNYSGRLASSIQKWKHKIAQRGPLDDILEIPATTDPDEWVWARDTGVAEEVVNVDVATPTRVPHEPDTSAIPTASGDMTLARIRERSTPDLHKLLRDMGDATKLVSIILAERETIPTQTNTSRIPDVVGEYDMRRISKLIGGIVGLLAGGLAAKGVLPAETVTQVDQVTSGAVTPELIFELLGTMLGVYFAPKNAE